MRRKQFPKDHGRKPAAVVFERRRQMATWAGAGDVAADIAGGADATRRYRYNERTAANLASHWLENSKENAAAVRAAGSSIPVNGLLTWLEKPDYFLSRDVVVVGAGPGLDSVWPQIHELVAAGADVWAADAALAPLVAAGIEPTAVLTVDPQPEILRYFEGVELPAKTALVVSNLAHPGTWWGRREAGSVIWYGIAAPADDVLGEINGAWPREIACVAGLGNVTGLAVGVCEVLGYRRIAVAGFDLSYGGGRFYCDNIRSPHAGRVVEASATAYLEKCKRFAFGVPAEARRVPVADGLHGQSLVVVDGYAMNVEGVCERDLVLSDPNLCEYARQFCEMGATLGWATTDPHVMVLGHTIVSPSACKIGRVFDDDEAAVVDRASTGATGLRARTTLRGAALPGLVLAAS